MKIPKTFVVVVAVFVRRLAAVCLLISCALQPLSTLASSNDASSNENVAALTGDKRIWHTLNRLSFGARPGEVERVRRTGVAAYIEEQLNPSKLDDRALEERLQNFPALRLSTAELLASYPNPGQLIRQMQQRSAGGAALPPELEGLRGGGDNDNKRTNNQTINQASTNASSTNASSSKAPVDTNTTLNALPKINDVAAAAQMNAPNPATADTNQREAQNKQIIARYYRENNLELPQAIMQQLQAARILRAVYSTRQLQEVLVDFWTNHFNVFANKGADKWYLVAYDRDVIRPNALGNFRQLLEATAKSSAMLFYLDNFQSVAPNRNSNRPKTGLMNRRRREFENNVKQDAATATTTTSTTMMMSNAIAPKRTRGINENYARELMELHTLGVDGGYTQKDVQEVARCFTGWTLYAPRGREPRNQRLATFAERRDLQPGDFYFNPRLHDDGEKIVLGHKIAAGGGIEDGEKVLDILATNPATAHFIAAKLARKFISDAPQPDTLARIEAAFTKSKGDIKETLRAVFATPEFNAESNFRAKIKTPFELVVSAMRALDVQTDARPAVQNTLRRLGEPLYGYQAPTGYPDTAQNWVNTGALLERLNFAVALASNRIPGTTYDTSKLVDSSLLRANQTSALTDELLSKLLGGIVSNQTKATLIKQITANQAATNEATRNQATKNQATTNQIAINVPSNNQAKLDETAKINDDGGSLYSGFTQQPQRQSPPPAMRRANQIAATRDNLSSHNNSSSHNNFSPAEQETRRIIGLIIGLPEFQRQ